MSVEEDRMWNIRDAILAFLYKEKAALRRPNHLGSTEIEQSVGWAADPINEDELNRDASYLESMGLIEGHRTWGGGLIQPRITAEGENKAAEGVSVRPGPPRDAVITGDTNITINNHGPSQNAVNSAGAVLNMTVEAQQDRAVAVADLLDALADQGHAQAEQARELSTELRDVSTDPVSNVDKLRLLLSTAMGVAATAAGSAVGQQITQAAISAIQGLPV